MAQNTADGTHGGAQGSGADSPTSEKHAPHDRKHGTEAPGGRLFPGLTNPLGPRAIEGLADMRCLCDTLDHATGQLIARSTTSAATSSSSPPARVALDQALAAAASRGAPVRAV